jgi:hypothetical protein
MAFVASPARAAGPSDDAVHFEAGARIGYGVPGGDVSGNNGNAAAKTSMSDAVQSIVPLVGEAGIRIARSIFVGAFFQYGFVSPNTGGTSCHNATSCDVHDTRLGVELLYHIAPAATVDPWLGVGFGYEWLSGHAEGNTGGFTVSEDETLSGFELVNLQLGVDFAATPNLGIGLSSG